MNVDMEAFTRLRDLRRRHVVALTEGLGNQMFQVAWAMALARTGSPVWLDTSLYRNLVRSVGVYDLMPELWLRPVPWMGLVPSPANRYRLIGRAIRRVRGPLRLVFEDEQARPTDHPWSTPAWWFGYWHDRDMVLDVLPEIRSLASIAEVPDEALGVHVRRTDFVRLNRAVDAAYYRRAIDTMLGNNPRIETVTFFSDDPDWCEQLVESTPRPATIARGGTAHGDLGTLAGHPYLVLSYGTFSWWASHLRDRAPGDVIVPAESYGPSRAMVVDPDWLMV